MQPGWGHWGEMRLGTLLTLLLLLCSSLEEKEISFTINDIRMESLPDWTVSNGQSLTLRCIVVMSINSQIKPKHTVLFYKNDVMFRSVSSTRDMESIFIPQARVHDSGSYKCSVILDKLENITKAYMVAVKGVPRPRVMLDKKEVIEGGVVAVTCAVVEERAPIHFTIEKLELDTKIVKEKKEKTSHQDDFVRLEFLIEQQDRILFFRCRAGIDSGIHMEISEYTKSELVIVRELFSIPKFHVSPPGPITEGDELHIRCTIQVTHLVHWFPEIIIKKDKEIVTSLYSNEAIYSVTAKVEHSGKYICKVQSGHISKVSSIMVKVTEFFSMPTFHVSPPGPITEGDELHIRCTIQVTHLVHKFPEIIILKDKEMVASRHSNEAIYSVTALVEHRGNYTCKVQSGHISKVSSIVVKVTELFPKPKLEISSTCVDQGEELDLQCYIREGPPASFTIQKEDVIVAYSGEFTKITSKWDSGMYTCTAGIGKVVKKSNPVQVTVCVFQDTPTEDVEYHCLADNCHSHPAVASEVLRVKVVAPVDEVKLSILLNEEVESGEEIILRCSVNEGTGPITYKFFRGQEDRPFHHTTLNETQAFWRQAQASKEQEGQYYCTASNRASLARSTHSNTLTVRVFLAPWKKGLIAVGAIGVVIAALIVAVKCYFLRKAKAKHMPTEIPRPLVQFLNSNKTMSDPSIEANNCYVLGAKNTERVYNEIQKTNCTLLQLLSSTASSLKSFPRLSTGPNH